MRRMKTAVASLAILGLLLVGATTALAQSDTTETPQDRRAEHEAEFAARLADELGIDVDRVSAALEAVRTEWQAEMQAERRAALEERLDAAVEAGDLTREQADALLEAHEAGVLGGPGFGRHRGRHGGGPGGPGFGFGHGPFGGPDEQAAPEAQPSADISA